MASIPETPYPIGTKYTLRRPRYSRECEVVDHLTTTNAAADVVAFRYVVSTRVAGQTVYDRDVVHTTIKRALEQ